MLHLLISTHIYAHLDAYTPTHSLINLWAHIPAQVSEPSIERWFSVAFVGTIGAVAIWGVVQLVFGLLPHTQQNRTQKLQTRLRELEIAELYLHQQQRYQSALNDITLSLVSRLDVNELLGVILQHAGKLLETEDGFFDLVNPSTDMLNGVAAIGFFEEGEDVPLKRGEGLGGRVWVEGKVMAIDDYRSWAGRLDLDRLSSIRSAIGIPLIDDKQVVMGVLGMARTELERPFLPAEVNVLEQFGRLASVALVNARLHSQMQHELAERTQAELKLRQSQTQLSAIAASIPACVYKIIWKPDGSVEIPYMSDGWKRLGLGNPEEIKQNPDLLVQAIHPDDRDMVTVGVIEAAQHDQLFNGEYRVNTISGEERWHRVSYQVELSDKNEITASGVTLDISESKRADEARRKAQEQFGLFLENLSDVVFVLNTDGTIRYVNASVKNTLGYSPEELVGRRIDELVAQERREETRRQIASLQQGYVPSSLPMRNRAIRKDGSICWVESKANVQLQHPEIKGIVMVTRDINAQVEVEQALRDSEARFRQIADSAPMLIWISDAKREVTFVNREWAEFTGAPLEEQMGNGWMRFMHAGDLAGYLALPHTTEFSDPESQEPFCWEYRLRRKDGEYRWMLDTAVRRYDADGVYLGQIGAAIDITERKLVEQKLAESEVQYRTVFNYVNDGLQVTNADTKEIVDVNAAMCAMHGYTREEYMRLPIEAMIAPNHPFVYAESQFANAFIGQSVNLKKDGGTFDVKVTGRHFVQNGQPMLLSIVHDISEQVNAEKLLRQRVEERTSELAQLLEVSQAIVSTLDQDKLLRLVLEKLRLVKPYTCANIMLCQEDGTLYLADYVGPVDNVDLVRHWRMPEHIRRMCDATEPNNYLVMGDVHSDLAEAQGLRTWFLETLGYVPPHTRAYMCVLLKANHCVIGVLVLEHDQPHAYTDQDAWLVRSFANQVAIAIENARLNESEMNAAMANAALNERSRLARELHDSVSQALFGITLGLRTAQQRTLASDPSAMKQAVDFSLDLAEGALSEMRALIFELRPESLEQEGLVSALQKQSKSMVSRYKIPVQLHLDEEPVLAMPIKQAMYRIAMEALQNVVKHASAKQVNVSLCQTNQWVELNIVDDGCGFDPHEHFPNRLGLHSMRERAEKVGGKLEITSQLQKGTCVQLRVCLPVQAEAATQKFMDSQTLR